MDRTPTHPLGLTARGLALVATILAAAVPAPADASTAQPLDLIDLIRRSDRILSGTVTRVTAGGTSGDAAYTEVHLRVEESLLGAVVEEYTFRQPAAAQGSPTWTLGERVVLFLDRPAATGLQTTVGEHQGKLRRFDGRLSSSVANEDLFADVAVDASGLSLDQVAMLEGRAGAVDAKAFLDLVRRAVREDWIARGVMHRHGEAPSTHRLPRAVAPDSVSLPTQ